MILLSSKNSQLIDITKQYLSYFSPNSPAISKIHRFDTENVHVHIAVCGTTLSRRSVRVNLSKADFAKSKIMITEYMKKYPELTSIQRHGLSKENGKLLTIKNFTNERNKALTELIDKHIPTVQSTKALQQILQANGYEIYMRSSRMQGIRHIESGYKTRFARLPQINLGKLQTADLEIQIQQQNLAEIQNVRLQSNKRELSSFLTEQIEGIELMGDQAQVYKEIQNLRQENVASISRELDSMKENDANAESNKGNPEDESNYEDEDENDDVDNIRESTIEEDGEDE